MKKTKNLDALRGIQCKCPTPSYRAGVGQALDLARQFIAANAAADDLDIDLDEDTGSLCIRWRIREVIHSLTYAARTLADLQRVEVSLPPEEIANISVQMFARVPMFDIDPATGFADGQPVRADFPERLQEFVAGFQDLNTRAYAAIFHPLHRAFAKEVSK